ncbi:MAG: hypothetical protein CSA58_05875 [Micrococcales bacterium]|nr:MAG: hypothetical protein CSA58_05875 [Micrococcales bacterium]
MPIVWSWCPVLLAARVLADARGVTWPAVLQRCSPHRWLLGRPRRTGTIGDVAVAIALAGLLGTTIGGPRSSAVPAGERMDAAGATIAADGRLPTDGNTASPGVTSPPAAANTRSTVTVTLISDQRRRAVRTTARTVSGLLREQGIVLGAADLVHPAPSAPLAEGTVVAVGRVHTRQETVRVRLPHGSTRVPVRTLAAGRTRIRTPGTDGTRVETYAVTTVDGTQISRTLVGSTSTAATAEVVEVGTGASSPVAASAGAWTGAHQPQGDTVWDRLAQCESGHDWQINTGNGYYGGLQFDLPTWREYGGTGYPHEHTREQQIAVARRLHAARGFAPWPACTAKLGLR